jgi:hypothetical protein
MWISQDLITQVALRSARSDLGKDFICHAAAIVAINAVLAVSALTYHFRACAWLPKVFVRHLSQSQPTEIALFVRELQLQHLSLFFHCLGFEALAERTLNDAITFGTNFASFGSR